MHRIQRILLLAFMAVFVLTGCEKSSEPTEETKTVTEVAVQQKDEAVEKVAEKSCELTMGWEPWEPYHYHDQEKVVKGLDIEMMELISAETGCAITYVKGDWKNLLQSLRKGQIDFLTGASITEKRKEYASFSDGYRTESFRLFVRTGEIEKYPGFNMKTLVDGGFRLGITMGYIYNDEVNTLQDDPANNDKITAVTTGLINFSKLIEGDIDGFLEDPAVGTSSILRQGFDEQIEMHPYVINTGDVHVMFSKNSVDEMTIANFNQALTKIRVNGRHQALMEKYTKLPE
jgi:polar amino acid transport system substrate-binding protein